MAERRVGPRRSEASKIAVQAAAIDELKARGWRGFSIDNVARNANASKQTIYKYWKGAPLLVVQSALETLETPKASYADKASLEDRIAGLISPWLESIRHGDGVSIWRGVILAAADDNEASDMFRAWLQETIRQPLREVLAPEAAHRRIRSDWDIDFALDILVGPVFQRLLSSRPIPERYPHRLAETLMAGLRTGVESR